MDEALIKLHIVRHYAIIPGPSRSSAFPSSLALIRTLKFKAFNAGVCFISNFLFGPCQPVLLLRYAAKEALKGGQASYVKAIAAERIG